MLLRLSDICVSFGGREVLKDFSLALDARERVCILGASGGGKTTLLNIIAGLLTPDGGVVERPEGRISYVFQEYRLLPWLTAEENITAAAGCSGELARELLAAMELEGNADSYPDELSGGMKQRVSIARALASDSVLILMDEPFKGLDPELRERVTAHIDAYCRDRAVILVTHDQAEAALMKCGRTYTM